MAETVYVLCALASIGCALMLWRSYRIAKVRLLLWTMICFVGLAANNVMLFVDRVVVPDVDLSILRALLALFAVFILLYGLIWDAK